MSLLASRIRATRRGLLAVAALALGGRRATAQPVGAGWSPSRPIRFVVPYAPGGGIDTAARQFADRLAPRLGQPVVVENRAGGGGTVGAEHVARSQPDGHTLLFTVMDPVINSAVLVPGLGYDPRRDFTPISQLFATQALLLGRAGLSANDLLTLQRDLTGSLRNRLSYGSYGAGGMGHLWLEAFNRKIGAGMPHTPYRGEAAMLTDLLAGTVDLGMGSIIASAPHIQAGSLRAYAVAGPARSPAMPDVPTFAELGHPEPVFGMFVWTGLFGPAGLPGAISRRLFQEVLAANETPELARYYASRGAVVIASSPEAFRASFHRDFATVTSLIRDFGLEVG